MNIDYLFAKNFDNEKVKIWIDVDGEVIEFTVNIFLLLNDIGINPLEIKNLLMSR